VAARLTAAALAKLPLEPYARVRPRLQSGDLLFTAGDYLVSQVIQKFTESPWSHVGILFRVDAIDRVLLLESVEDVGVRFAPLSKYLEDYEAGKPYSGRAVIARCAGITPPSLEKLAAFGTDQLTRAYDRDEVVTILARIALGKPPLKRDDAYICSELVYECFARAGLEFTYDKRGFISPENIWRDRRLELVARIL
jgi:hypothetical protein